MSAAPGRGFPVSVFESSLKWSGRESNPRRRVPSPTPGTIARPTVVQNAQRLEPVGRFAFWQAQVIASRIFKENRRRTQTSRVDFLGDSNASNDDLGRLESPKSRLGRLGGDSRFAEVRFLEVFGALNDPLRRANKIRARLNLFKLCLN